jgi:hypothetical protein
MEVPFDSHTLPNSRLYSADWEDQFGHASHKVRLSESAENTLLAGKRNPALQHMTRLSYRVMAKIFLKVPASVWFSYKYNEMKLADAWCKKNSLTVKELLYGREVLREQVIYLVSFFRCCAC